VLHQYEVLYEAYVHDRQGVAEGDLVEVSFAELEEDPVAVLQKVYGELGLECKLNEARVQEYCASLGEFKKNHHRTIPAEMKEVVLRHWGPSFDTFGYSKELPPSLSGE